MTNATAAEPEAKQAPAPAKRKPRLLAAGSALGGMILGSLVGMGVRMGVESTGLLGPGIEGLIADQQTNFDGINERLDAMQSASTDPELRRHLSELRALVQRQSALSEQAASELQMLSGEVSSMRAQQLAERGYAGGADFWLQTGESVNVGDEQQVFGLIRYWGPNNRSADVNLSGTRQRMAVGDSIAVPDANCTIFYKQGLPRDDGRIGFDISCG
jgi:hypothetical protein